MIPLDFRRLLTRLNPVTRRALESGATSAVTRGHYELTAEHMLVPLLEDPHNDLPLALRQAGMDTGRFAALLNRALDGLRRGNGDRPAYSPHLKDWFGDAWLIASIDLGEGQIRSGALLAALLASPLRHGDSPWFEFLLPLRLEQLRADLPKLFAFSKETEVAAPAGSSVDSDGRAKVPAGGSALSRFTTDFTEQARLGRIDPVFCRDREIKQMIDVLGRRRKNNPICVGDPGVGKTAVVEGLALRITQGDVPDFLKNVSLRGLDMGLLQAGAGMKGEFENRLKKVVEEVKASVQPVILFIDEAHTLVGAGGQAGGGDAANLLKPALARGELRTIAATTWSEYKKYFEKDPALTRRFELVKLDEPSVEDAVTIIRGLRPAYEKAHGVHIRDAAVIAAARLSARYLSGRQLPDKAVDLIDTAGARVKLSLGTKPTALEEQERAVGVLEREREALLRDRHAEDAPLPRIAEIDSEIASARAKAAEVAERWQREKAITDRLVTLRRTVTDAAAGKEPDADMLAELRRLDMELKTVQGREPLVHHEVTPEVVGQVVADWTGIPVGSMVRDEAASILALENNLLKRIKGQEPAIAAVAQGIQSAKAGIGNPNAPMGVFLLVGPSGVGKTETATAVADLLFGGDRFMCSINMSEFQEKHTISRLVGSPPGYVGYGEGGVLTEAIRQRPYSVVLLDEVEKADLEVLNLFYQVFDKGTLSDGEGRVIDCRNTAMFLTSNLATDALTRIGQQPQKPGHEEIVETIRPILSRHFKPALLARMTIVPYLPLRGDSLAQITRLKLDAIGKRLAQGHRIRFSYEEHVVDEIARRCTEVETGARNIDHIIGRALLPRVSSDILGRLSEGGVPDALHVGLDGEGGFSISFG